MSETGSWPQDMPDRAGFHSRQSKAIESSLRGVLRDDEADGDAALKNARYSQYHKLLLKMVESAETHAVAQRQSADQYAGSGLYEAIEVCQNLRNCFHKWGDETEKAPDAFKVWRHETNATYLIQAEKRPYISRSELEGVTGEYLRLPIRCQMTDRILVDALVALEMFDYGKEMFAEERIFGFPARSPLKKRHVLLGYFIGLLRNLVVLGGAAAVVFYLGSKGSIGSGWAMGMGVALIGLFVVGWVISTIALPFVWRHQSRARRKVVDLMQAMLNVYAEMRSDGPISAARIYDLATDAAKVGVVFPPPLFVLLDDIKKRSGHF